MQSKFRLLLLATTFYASIIYSQTAHLNFSEYGFKVKFLDGAKPVTAGFFFNKYFIKGYEYLREELNGTIKARLEIYKFENCFSLRTWEEQISVYTKTLNNQPDYFSQIKLDGYYDAYGWLTLSCEAENPAAQVQKRLLRAYCSSDYVVILDVLLAGNKFIATAKSLVTDDAAGKSFVSLGIVHKMPDLGIQMRLSGNVLNSFDSINRCYWYFKCIDTPALYPHFNIRLYTPEWKNEVQKRIGNLSSEKKILFSMEEEIRWPAEGKFKFTNGKRVAVHHYDTGIDGNKYPVLEEYYSFDFNKKSYLVIHYLVLKNDPELKGYRELKNFTSRLLDIASYYGNNLLSILETIEKM